MEKTIEMLKGKARDSWSGETGEKRAEDLEKYLRGKLEEYSNTLDIPQSDILNAWEKDRTYSAINYYQEANQPKLDASFVRVFDTVDDFRENIKEKGFRCPSCRAVSTSPYECDSKQVRDDGKECDWKVYGFLRDLGKGVYIFVKEEMRSELMFMPIAWEEVTA